MALTWAHISMLAALHSLRCCTQRRESIIASIELCAPKLVPWGLAQRNPTAAMERGCIPRFEFRLAPGYGAMLAM
jgi:hypothetical protein